MPNIIGTNIRRIRKSRGISSDTLARMSGVTHVRHIELGTRTPRIATLEKIAATLGVEVGDLFSGTGAGR